MRIAEVIGLPGSGKTTVIDNAGQRLCTTVKLLPATAMGGRGLLGRLWATVRCPLASLYFYGFVLFRRNTGLRHLVGVFSVQKRYLTTFAERSHRDVIVDEGVIHGMFSAAFGSSSSYLSTCFLRLAVARLIGKGGRFYYLDVDKSTCVERFRNRVSGSRFSTRFSVHLEEFMRCDYYQELNRVLGAHFPDKVFSHSSIDAMVERIAMDFCSDGKGGTSGPIMVRLE